MELVSLEDMAKACEESLTSARDKRASKIHVHAQDSKGTRSKMHLLYLYALPSPRVSSKSREWEYMLVRFSLA